MQMREADDSAIKRSRIYVDTPSALSEGGDIAQALQAGVIVKTDIAGDLAALVGGTPGRRDDQEITLFKSVGASIEDLAAAALVYRTAK